MRGEVRARRREGVGLWRGGSGMHGERPGGQSRARAERTLNMKAMFVTPEVSQLEMSALKFCKL